MARVICGALALLLAFFIAAETSAKERDPYRQVEVKLEWRRVGIIREETVHNVRNGKYEMLISARWQTLLAFDEEAKGTSLREEVSSTMVSTPITGSVTFVGEAKWEKAEEGIPQNSSIEYSGKLGAESISLRDVAPGKEFFTTPKVEVDLAIPMTGSSTGYLPALGPDAGLAIFYAPFEGGHEDPILSGNLTLFGDWGPRPGNTLGQQAYDIAKGLSDGMGNLPGATTAVWKGAVYEESGKSWRFHLNGTKNWDLSPGSITDTLSFEMIPTARTLKAPADDADY